MNQLSSLDWVRENLRINFFSQFNWISQGTTCPSDSDIEEKTSGGNTHDQHLGVYKELLGFFCHFARR